MLQRQIASFVLEKFCENLSLQHNFVAATCCKKSNQTEFVPLVAATKFSCRDKDFHQISPVHTRLFVAAMCRRNMLLQLVAGPVHTEWSVAATFCCNLSPPLSPQTAKRTMYGFGLQRWFGGNILEVSVYYLMPNKCKNLKDIKSSFLSICTSSLWDNEDRYFLHY